MIMRLVSFRMDADSRVRTGALVEEQVIDLGAAAQASGDEGCEAGCWDDLAALLACDECLAAARRVVEGGPQGISAGEVEVLAPIPRPPKVFCLATNFMSHLQEGISRKLQDGKQARELDTPRVFMKPSSNTIIGSGVPVRLSKISQWVDYEAEMAVIIGEPAKEVSVEQAGAHVSAVTVFNDISERELSIWERIEERDWDKFFDWLNGKWQDGFAPMGPCAVPISDIGDPDDLDLTLRLNGEMKQEANTREMIFNVAEIVSYLSHICTLETGDVIACGTPAGVGKNQGIKLQDGDLLEVEIPPIGVLSTPVGTAGNGQ